LASTLGAVETVLPEVNDWTRFSAPPLPESTAANSVLAEIDHGFGLSEPVEQSGPFARQGAGVAISLAASP
jgi:hypothetical protein